MKNFCFEHIWNWILIILVVLVATLITMATVSDHTIRGYYITSNTGNTGVSIYADMNWCPDDKIPLDRSITLLEAVIVVEQLNLSIKKK